MDGTDGAKFATLQRTAEVEIESMFEILNTQHCIVVCVVVYEEAVPCVCVGEWWGLLYVSGEH